MLFYTADGGSKFIGIRLPTTTTPTVKWSWESTSDVIEQLSSDNTWTLKMENTGQVTAVSPTKAEFSFTFSVLGGDISAMKIGFNDFDLSTTNCYRIFNPNKVDVGK